MLGVRDLIMADTLRHVLARERGRGKVLAFAAGAHLKPGPARWRLLSGGEVEWWPAGSHLTQALGPRYAVIGMALGVSEANGVAPPEPGTLEAALAAAGGSRFLPTHRGSGPLAPGIQRAPPRSGSTANPTYSWLTPDSFSDFEWLVFLDSTTYPRGAQPLSDWDAG
jgi:erythromycin esterase